MKRRRCLLAVLLAGVIAAMPVTQISFAAENTGIMVSEGESESETKAESESGSETESGSGSESGSETEEKDPNVPEGYKGIYNIADLAKIAENPDGNFMLMADMDLSGTTYNSIAVFRGVLNGNKHTIKGLKTAFIQVLEKGSISDLTFSGVEVTGNGDTGVLANVIGTGKQDQIQLSNISVTGKVTGTGNTGVIAGLVKGSNIAITGISNSANISGGTNAGGLIGLIQATDDQQSEANITITLSYNIGEVAGAQAGGLVGAVEIANLTTARNVEIANCYNAGVLTKGANMVGKVSAGNGRTILNKCIGIQLYYSDAAGMIGTAALLSGSTQTSACSVSNCYYYSMNPVYAFADAANITGTATALDDVQVRTQAYFKEFDFSTIWGLDEKVNGGYPYLRQTALLPVQYVTPTAGTVLLDSKTEGKYLITERDKTVSYAGVLNEELQSVTIPSQVEINGVTYNVTAIAQAAMKGNTKIKNVSVPYSVTEVGKYAFQGCTSLVKVSSLKYAKAIYQEAFDGCTSLTTIGTTSYRITLPSVEMIGVRAFRRVSKVHRVYISSKNLTTIKKGAFRECTGMTKFNVVSTKLNSLQKYSLYGNSKLKTIIIRSSELTSSRVGTKVFKGIKSTATFYVPSAKISSYKSIFKSKGAGSKFKIKSV